MVSTVSSVSSVGTVKSVITRTLRTTNHCSLVQGSFCRNATSQDPMQAEINNYN